MKSTNSATIVHNRAASAKSPHSVGVLNRPATVANSATSITSRYKPTLSEKEAAQQAFLLKALANPTRLRILNLLSRYEGEVCVYEIVENFPLEQPTISHHLRILRDAGLIDCEKQGLWAYYYLRHDSLKRAQELISELAL